MKFNCDFPYIFHNLKSPENNYINFSINNEHLIIDFKYFDYNSFGNNVDIVLEIENTQTFFRRLYKVEIDPLTNKNKPVEISLQILGDKFEYCLILVSNKNAFIEIDSLTDYYEKGDCIGVLESDIYLLEKNEGLSGLIKVASTTSDSISFDLSSDWITIQIPKNVYDKYYNWQTNTENTPYSLASMGFTSIQFAIFRALEEEALKEKKWWQTISKLMSDIGYSEDELDFNEVPDVTNKILGNCFEVMINSGTPDIDVEDTSKIA